ncbi:MAG: chorismate lyase [Nitrosomonas sp.]|nr:MAG: chorismate lyase [Nitrosomonas sp.]
MSSRNSGWHPVPVSASPTLRWWLLNQHSLTDLIKQRCNQFRVEPTFQALARACHDELSVIGLHRNELALIREVYLYCGDRPVVFAHSVIARNHLQGVWRGLSRLGNQSLGSLLFSNPLIKRQDRFSFRQLNDHHLLYHRACQRMSPNKSRRLWARRRAFSLYGRSILVTEIFLPAILEL